MVEQEQVYEYMKEYINIEFTSRNLAILFDCTRNHIVDVLKKIYKNKHKYPGITRNEEKRIALNGRYFICYLYSVKKE